MEAHFAFADRGKTVKSANQQYEPAKSVACDDAVAATVTVPLKSSNSNVSETAASETIRPSIRSRSMSVYYHPSEKQQSGTVFKTEENAPCFALIEWDTDDGEPAAYTVIESSQIVTDDGTMDRLEDDRRGERKSDSGLYTGKLIHVRRGRYVMTATIVMISEDKKFLETELQELRIMAANNMISKSVAQPQPPARQQHLPTLMYYGASNGGAPSHPIANPTAMRVYGGDEHWNTNKSAKRQRCNSGSSLATKDVTRHATAATSTNSVQEVNEETTISISSDCSLQPDSPPPPVRTKVARFSRTEHRTSARHDAPPMTFDQQTQTTGTASDAYGAQEVHLTRIMSYLESIMAEQKSSRMEGEYNRKLLHELQEKLLDQQTLLTEVRLQLTEMQSKQDTNETIGQPTMNSDLIVTRIAPTYRQSEANGLDSGTVYSYETTNNNHIVVSGLRSADTAEQWVKLQNDGVIVTEQEHPTNSNLSWASTAGTGRNSTPTTTTTNCTADDGAATKANSMIIEYESEIVNTVGSTASSPTAVQDLLKDDWDDITLQEKLEVEGAGKARIQQRRTAPEGTQQIECGGKKVAIGANNTMISQKILDTIRWDQYKSATRKLLLTLFSREKLAGSSLSGRACPALQNTDRPVKEPLPPKVVADIIECVTKRCDVDDSLVRVAITTKCADEHKMLRMRMKQKNTPPQQQTSISSGRRRTATGSGNRSESYDKENISLQVLGK